ncbi:thyrotropin-releasing hormone-degrading ectoenzyme-like isoform X2 [Tenrec ecaudatus]|uniref:thyrotropin-releasing hormone-degrading ectoenzyme-like isoform X2 n=1 Tax=Tenrec ecaudatus TaxID=94439 RepID=UPI003F59E36F
MDASSFLFNRREVRLYARPDAIRRGSGHYALHITKRLIEFYEDYFKVPYSLPKLDLLAVPKHPYAAMENWGLSIFVEQRILLDPSMSSISYLLDVTMVIVHEICHQWFGDLVTPVWWEDVWLKEGFAHYFEFVGTDYLYPGWNMGAALIRMLANFMGHSVFQRGLQDYLTIHKYGNAARNDLWNAFSEALKRNGKYVNIQEVMDQWTLQKGYPVITILGNATAEKRVTITQQRFIYDISAKTKTFEHRNSRAGYLPQNIPLEMIRYLSEEKDFLPWHAASRALYPLDKLLDRMENYNVFNEYILKQVATTYLKLGWPKNNFNGSLVQASYQHEELRREVIMLVCSFGNKHCHQQASTLISDWISSNRNRYEAKSTSIVPSVSAHAYLGPSKTTCPCHQCYRGVL